MEYGWQVRVGDDVWRDFFVVVAPDLPSALRIALDRYRADHETCDPAYIELDRVTLVTRSRRSR